ncbi:monosaccharide ABC transporter substrate-binding protein, CUT2 family [Leifsonia sp. 21MFCrub1.1]|nr:monosaccharide ABC transporter substrate-binding protein, CUT2 family [Leifsonia sp. 21MFCrub1.1]
MTTGCNALYGSLSNDANPVAPSAGEKGHSEVKLINTRRGLAVLAIASTAALLAACSSTTKPSSNGLDDGFGKRSADRKAYFFTYYNAASDVFWAQIQKGADDAAKLGGLKMVNQTAAGDDSKMVDLIQAAIAQKPALMFIPFNSGEKWVKQACEAHQAGISIIAYNVPAPDDGKACVDGFVGQDFTAVGKILGQQLLKDVPDLSSGDTVLLPAEEPSQPYAIQRGGGVQQALDAKGVKGVYLRTSGTDSDALDAMTTWLTAHKDVKAIVPLGGTPNRNAVAAEDAAGVKVPIVGFDTSPQVIAAIKSGRELATADQQGYVQGFQSVMQGVLKIDFGLSAADINSGGNGLITKDNVTFLEAKDLQGVRY